MSDAPELILYQEALRRVTAERDAALARAEKAEAGLRQGHTQCHAEVAGLLTERRALNGMVDAARAEAATMHAANSNLSQEYGALLEREAAARAEAARYRAALEEIRDLEVGMPYRRSVAAAALDGGKP